MNLPVGIQRLLPFLRWRRPTMTSLKSDAWAGISVGIVLIPQAVAYATLAGMPPETGLYAALLPSLVGILWGSSPLLAVGPVALTSLLTFGSLSALATPGSDDWVSLAIWLALYSGLIQLALGFFKLGRIANLVSQPVMTGFINAAAIIIIVSQLPPLLGMAGYPSMRLTWFADGLPALPAQAFLPAAFGMGALLGLFALKRFAPALPGVLIVSAAGIAASFLLDYAAHGGEIVGRIASGMPDIALPPDIPLTSHQELWPAALVLALISFTEAMSSCRVLARKTNERWSGNQELIGQGLAKMMSALNGAFPVSGSFSRSALNLYAGATSAWSTLFAVLCVFLSLQFLTGVIYYMPMSVLAAMVMMPVFSLIDIAAFKRIFAISRSEGGIAVVTFLVTLFSIPRLHWGVVAGVGLTMASFLYRRTQPRIIEVSQHEDGTLRDRARFGLKPLAPDLLAVRIDAALNFLTAAALERFVTDSRLANPRVKRVLLCSNAINDIDTTGIDTLASLQKSLASEGVDLYLSAVKKQIWEVLEKAGLVDILRPDHFFPTDSAAVAALSRRKEGFPAG